MSRTTGASNKASTILSAKRVHQCNICGKNFPFKVVLDMHKKDHVFKNHYKCHLCPSAYPKKSQLEMHHRAHTGERPYRCDECSAAFMNNSNLHRHKRKHAGKKKYDCNEWEAALALSNTLSNDKQVKKSEMPISNDKYKLDMYGQIVDKSSLLIHKKKHDKLYICDSAGCGLSFQNKINLEYHKLKHTNEDNNSWQHTCGICGENFTTRTLLHQHEQKHNEKFSLETTFDRDQTCLTEAFLSNDYLHNSEFASSFHTTDLHFQGIEVPEAVQPSMILNEQPQSLHDNQLQELHSPSHFFISHHSLANLNEYTHNHITSSTDDSLHVLNDQNINSISVLPSPVHYQEENITRNHTIISDSFPTNCIANDQTESDNYMRNQNITTNTHLQNLSTSCSLSNVKIDTNYDKAGGRSIKREKGQNGMEIKDEPAD